MDEVDDAQEPEGNGVGRRRFLGVAGAALALSGLLTSCTDSDTDTDTDDFHHISDSDSDSGSGSGSEIGRASCRERV